ncbi:uncharacterized protein STEHIDRAFT_102727 [Stereum hirsutum FP-91666 SS1]|uniref:uncharacterized protein n=1 Tax=Stereum hirsutum (strain FP-91666) TaxID=721885 RepID=UPI00044496FC|nr:uncharacterized protein STEHIDRAFT_102727 [Stereum hirsutum FP-91666 SS1]EIM82231.1 hypothetical protein STEHIDRAFT_102727 [Stereum hirsutum FP-91666 SS1]
MPSGSSESDFEDIASAISSVISVDIDMSKFPTRDGFTTPGSGEDDAGISAPEYPPHERFWFDDGSVTFVVEGTAYFLHRFLFKLHSTTFAQKFLAGHTDPKDPIILKDVEKDQFDAFLNVLYRTSFTSDPAQSAAAWASVLHLATEWDFPSIRNLAIKNFTPSASDVDKIVLGHRYRFEEWLLPGYTGLCERKEPLTPEEGDRLEKQDIIAIARVREELRSNASAAEPIEMTQSIRCQSCNTTHNYSFNNTQTSLPCQTNYYGNCQSIPLPVIKPRSSSSPSLPDTAAITKKVRSLIPRSTLQYVTPRFHHGHADGPEADTDVEEGHVEEGIVKVSPIEDIDAGKLEDVKDDEPKTGNCKSKGKKKKVHRPYY